MVKRWQILLADKESRMLALEKSAFSQDSFEVSVAVSYEQAWKMFQRQSIHLVICEWDNGELLDRIRAISKIPVIIVSSHTQDSIRIRAFQKGADDFVAKPFNLEELRLRTERLLHYFYERTESSQKIERYQYEFFDLDVVHRKLQIHHKEVHLTAREFDLLFLLVQSPGKVHSRKECLQKVWHYTYFGEERIVDNCIRKIREKLAKYSEKAANAFVTVWKKGYLFDPQKMKD